MKLTPTKIYRGNTDKNGKQFLKVLAGGQTYFVQSSKSMIFDQLQEGVEVDVEIQASGNFKNIVGMATPGAPQKPVRTQFSGKQGQSKTEEEWQEHHRRKEQGLSWGNAKSVAGTITAAMIREGLLSKEDIPEQWKRLVEIIYRYSPDELPHEEEVDLNA